MPSSARRFTGRKQQSRTFHNPKPSGEAARGNSAARGYTWQWRRARVQWLNEHPLCVACQAANRTVEATIVDHITPHRGSERLFWDETNWQSLCERCHNEKTARGE